MKWVYLQTCCALVISVWLTSCGGPSVNMAFDSSVPSDQQAILQADNQIVANLNITNTQPNDLQVMGTPDLTAPTLVSWLNQNVNVIVGESFDWEANSSATPDPNYTTTALSDMIADSSSSAQTLMWNVGTYVYLNGRSNGEIFTLQTSIGSVYDNTPEVGVIEIGAGEFDPDQLIQNSPVNSLANSYVRIPIEFHEGMHCKGYGPQLAGYPHAMCPSGNYAGDYACESHLNGPYGKQAMLESKLLNICNTCTSSEQNALALVALDYAGRMLPLAVLSPEQSEQMN
jgi:hypothetical protein